MDDFQSRSQSKFIPVEGTDSFKFKLMENERRQIKEQDILAAQEFKWRAGAATFWSILFAPIVLAMFEVLLHVELFRPVLWIQGFISNILSWKFVLFIIPFQTLCIANAIFHYKCTRVYPTHHRHNWDQLLFILHPKQLSWILLNSVLGMLFTAMLYSLSYDTEKSRVFNHDVKYILMFGLILGLRYGVCFYTQRKYLLEFPVLQEQKFVRFRASLPLCFKSAIIECFQTLKVCFILYITSSFLGKLLDFLLSSESGMPSLLYNNSLWENLSMLWICLTFGTTILATFNVTQTLSKIFASQAYPFILESSFIGDHRLLLQDSLYSSHEILKHLAFFDLCKSSKYESTRRSKIFSITQPGGHPETWNLVLPKCLSAIESSKQRFSDATVSQLKKGNLQTASDLFNPEKTTFVQDRFMSPGTQNALASPLFSPRKNVNDFGSPTFKPPPPSMFSPVKNWCSTEDVKCSTKNQTALLKKDQKSTLYKRFPLLSGLFEELPEYKTQQLFQDQQLISWVLEGLSCLVAASFNEDTYGVVQRNLADILIYLLSYLEKIERYIKTTVSEEKTQLNKLREFQKRKSMNSTAQSYRIAVQSAVYKITTKFGRNLDSLRIPREYRKRLAAFIEFRD